MADVTRAWARLEKAVGAHAKKLSMRPGTTPQKIAAAEKKLGFALPDELRALLQLHDGQKASGSILSVLPIGGHFLPLKDIVDFWNMNRREANPDEEEDKAQDKGRVRSFLSHPKRIPLGGDFEMGNAIYIDQIPAKKGTMDQVIGLVSECDYWVLGASLTSMIAGTAMLVEQKKLTVVDDPLRLENAKGELGYGSWSPLLRALKP